MSVLKVGVSRILAAGMIATVVGSAAKAADDLPIIDDIRMPEVNVDVRIGDDHDRPPPYFAPPRYRADHRRGAYFAMPPASYQADVFEHPVVSPYKVATALRSNGYSLLGQINRRGWVYTVSVIDPRGDDGRAIIDARTGAIIRFIPAFAVNGRLNDQLGVIYGPPGPPSLRPIQELRQGARSVADKGAVKNAARRSPDASNVVSRHEASQKPSRDPANARAEMKSEAPSASVQASPPRDLKLWPTQAMPTVQAFD